jgi:phosphoserine/homoserine phosphotransferase
MIIVTDLEGVLVPEIWQEIAEATGVEELLATTHDEPDFDRLMARRVEILARHDLRLPDLQRVAADVIPYPGATELLAWARTRGQVMIASDSFHELSEGIVLRLGGYSLFANTFKVDAEGRIHGYRLRIRGRKDNVVRSLKEIGFHIVAIGDGYNDEFMFRVADDAILYRAPADLAARIPGGHQASSFEDLHRIIASIHARRTQPDYQSTR